jgi:hypothetical protein
MMREDWLGLGMSAFSQLAVLLELANRELQCKAGPSTVEVAAAAAATAIGGATAAAACTANDTAAKPQAAAARPACSALAGQSSSGSSVFDKMLQVLQQLVTKGE